MLKIISKLKRKYNKYFEENNGLMNIKMRVEGKTVTIWALTLKEKEKCGQP